LDLDKDILTEQPIINWLKKQKEKLKEMIEKGGEN